VVRLCHDEFRASYAFALTMAETLIRKTRHCPLRGSVRRTRAARQQFRATPATGLNSVLLPVQRQCDQSGLLVGPVDAKRLLSRRANRHKRDRVVFRKV
jgi:hypothetical protein